MAEYIEREAVLNLVDKGFLVSNGNYNKVKKLINEIPAADVQPIVHSTWDKHGYACPCMNCGYDFGYAGTPLEMKMKYEFKYCPSCGARMTWKGGEDG